LRYFGVIESMSKKVKTSIALDKDLLEWIDKMISTKKFANRTHAIEYALQKLREEGIGLEWQNCNFNKRSPTTKMIYHSKKISKTDTS